MKKLNYLLVISSLFFAGGSSLIAQDFLLRVTSGSSTSNFSEGDCGYGLPVDEPETWGWDKAIYEELCAPIAWGYDVIGNDSLGCDSIPSGSLAGQVALIRRGDCNFSKKALNAQKAGAVAILIVNHNINATETGCTVFGLQTGVAGDTTAQSVTIPTMFIGRAIGELIDANLSIGQEVEICLSPVSLFNPGAELSHAIPLAHRDTMFLIRTSVSNRTNAPIDINVTARITEPDGNIVEFKELIANVAPSVDVADNQDSVAVFPLYLPPALEGIYKVQFFSDVFTESFDTIERLFRLTPSTFATDNFNINGSAAIGPAVFVSAATNRTYTTGARYITANDATTKAMGVTFGIGNPAVVATGDPGKDMISIGFYDADVNNDGLNDIPDEAPAGSQIGTYLTSLLGFADYVIDANAAPNTLVTVPLTDVATGELGVSLLPNHFYYSVISYDGNPALADTCIAFTTSEGVNYFRFDGAGLGSTTPLRLDNFYDDGWAGSTVVNRVQLDLTSSVKPNPKLDAAKVKVLSNPANEQMTLQVELTESNPTLAVSLLDNFGKIIETQVKKDFQTGQLTFNTQRLPSGGYALWVRTSAEGSRTIPVMICH
jgi:PA domain